jgi:hypothetical protein
MYLKDTKCKAMDWIPLNQDGDQWQAHVKIAIHFSVQQKAGNFLTVRKLPSSPEGL